MSGKELSLTPQFRVDQAIVRGAHFYDVYLEKNQERTHRFPGVTGALSVINKPDLIPWAKREALGLVERALMRRIELNVDKKITLTREWIDALMQEASARPDKIKEDAANLGTRVHAIIDRVIHGQNPYEITMKQDELPAVDAFQAWWKNSGIELVMGDTKVASLLHKYGGSLDALGRRNGQFIILDWKTSNGIYTEYALQVAAYAQAFYETYGIYCQEGIIVRFGKKLPVDFETKTIRDLEGSFQAFLNAKALRDSLEMEHFLEAI